MGAAIANAIYTIKIIAAIIAAVLFFEAFLMWLFGIENSFFMSLIVYALKQFFLFLTNGIIIPMLAEITADCVTFALSFFNTGYDGDLNRDLIYPLLAAANDWFPVTEAFYLMTGYLTFVVGHIAFKFWIFFATASFGSAP